PHSYDEIKKKHNLKDEKIVLAAAPLLMSDIKGGREVLRLAEKLKDKNIKFILIGLKHDETGENFGSNVIALERTEDQQELAAYYSMADCFVICSEMENFPTSCVEAVCCGTPVVGYSAGGTAETAPEPLGLFCKYGDLDTLSSNLLYMLKNPPKTEYFEKIRQFYSAERMYREYLQVYNELLDRGEKS
ncbi:MAG: glycosyltransferase family 4 protein, partial [Candidatus Limivicinus sp.]